MAADWEGTGPGSSQWFVVTKQPSLSYHDDSWETSKNHVAPTAQSRALGCG